MTDRCGLTIALLGPAASVHIRRWASALGSAGHRVVVVSWQPGPDIAGSELRIAPRAGEWPARRAAAAAGWLHRLISDVRPDVVHVHSLGAHGLLALALPRGIPVVATPWGSELRAARRSPPRTAVIWLALRRAALVLPTSAAVAAELASRYAIPPARIRVLSWGVPAELISALPGIRGPAVRREFGIPADATVVLAIRSAAATYRTREVVAAFARAAAHRPELFLVVLAGHRQDRESARRAKDCYLGQVRAAADGTGDRILTVRHALTPIRAFELMCASDVAVSVPAGDQRSSSVLEAALAGCHLVLSDIAPYRELVRDGLTAELLPEPITETLARHLEVTSADPTGRCGNQKFILTQENGAAKAAELERSYRELAAASRAGTLMP